MGEDLVRFSQNKAKATKLTTVLSQLNTSRDKTWHTCEEFHQPMS